MSRVLVVPARGLEPLVRALAVARISARLLLDPRA